MSSTRRPRLIARMTAAVALVLAGTAALAPSAQAVDPVPNPTIKVLYDANGTTRIGAQINKDLQLGPTVLTSVLDTVSSKIVDGALPIPSQKLNFTIAGLIPARADVTLTQVGPLTGTLDPTGQRGKLKLTSNISYDIKISNVEFSILGIIWLPLVVGDNCHTVNPVNITATTPDGEFFTINGGGRVTGTYTIGEFTGCAPLNLFNLPFWFPKLGSIPINALVSGTNNTLSLTLSNPRNGG